MLLTLLFASVCVGLHGEGEDVGLPTELMEMIANKGLEDLASGLRVNITVEPSEDCKQNVMDKDFVEIAYDLSIDSSSPAGMPGQVIDTSRDTGLKSPMIFQMGTGQAIEGLDRGVADMCVGEKRSLIIKSHLAYGDKGYVGPDSDNEYPLIPPGATINYQVELLQIIRLQIKTISKVGGCEKSAVKGSGIKAHYTLSIHPTSVSGDRGSKIMSSKDDDSEPLEFELGAGQVILGLDQGLVGHCQGEKLEMIVPPEFGYEDKGLGKAVPPGATLLYEVEILEVNEGNMFAQMDSNEDGKVDIEEVKSFMKRMQDFDDETEIQNQFLEADENGDGFIDWDEAPFAKGEAPANADKSGSKKGRKRKKKGPKRRKKAEL